MAKIGTLRRVVHSPMQSYEFHAVVHRAHCPAEQMIEPEFYIKYASKPEGTGQPHEGIHYELELVVSPAYERVHPDVPIHAHKNPNTKKYFVCYTGPITTDVQATELFEHWCVGTAFAVERSEDFAPFAYAHQDDFLQFMEKEHGFLLAA